MYIENLKCVIAYNSKKKKNEEIIIPAFRKSRNTVLNYPFLVY